mgnify:CR=1 FL=1
MKQYDVNNDGRVTECDAQIIQKYLAELFECPALDVNEDGIVDVEKARKYYEEAASYGYAYAFNNLARIALNEGNEIAAIKYFKMSGDLGESWALNKLGEFYRKKGELSDAFFYYNESIKSHSYEKHYYAYYNLAKYFYMNGYDSKYNKDIDKAVEYLDIASSNNILNASLELFYFYCNNNFRYSKSLFQIHYNLLCI